MQLYPDQAGSATGGCSMSDSVLNTSKDGGSTTSLNSLSQSSTTLTTKMFLLIFIVVLFDCLIGWLVFLLLLFFQVGFPLFQFVPVASSPAIVTTEKSLPLPSTHPATSYLQKKGEILSSLL